MARTCLQRVCVMRGPRKGTVQTVRRPHVTAGPTASGYTTCTECGADIYVGQGHMSPQAMQRAEHDAARADRMR